MKRGMPLSLAVLAIATVLASAVPAAADPPGYRGGPPPGHRYERHYPGDDIKYVKPFAREIHGIDISREAVEKISDSTIDKHVGDISTMNMFADNQFDIVLVPLFFHHFVKYGFNDFLKEIYRTLKPGGHFFAIEPSSFYPLNCVIKCIKKTTGNITGAVEEKHPLVLFCFQMQ